MYTQCTNDQQLHNGEWKLYRFLKTSDKSFITENSTKFKIPVD